MAREHGRVSTLIGSTNTAASADADDNLASILGVRSAWVALLEATSNAIENSTPLRKLALEAVCSQSATLVWAALLLDHMINSDLLSVQHAPAPPPLTTTTTTSPFPTSHTFSLTFLTSPSPPHHHLHLPLTTTTSPSNLSHLLHPLTFLHPLTSPPPSHLPLHPPHPQVVYPLSMFGYGLLEAQPPRGFFTILTGYTITILWLKLLYQLPLFLRKSRLWRLPGLHRLAVLCHLRSRSALRQSIRLVLHTVCGQSGVYERYSNTD